MVNRALIEAIGTDGKSKKLENKDARDVIKKMKSVVEHFNKSANMDAKFKDLTARVENMNRRDDDIGCFLER